MARAQLSEFAHLIHPHIDAAHDASRVTSGKYDPLLLQLVSDWQRGAGDDKQRVKRGKHGNTQDEVVLEIDTLEESDIWVLGGWSNSFDDLVKRTFWLLHGHQPSESEFDELKASVAELSPEAGARWLQPESSLRVLSRMRPKVEALREIERQREAIRSARDKEVVE